MLQSPQVNTNIMQTLAVEMRPGRRGTVPIIAPFREELFFCLKIEKYLIDLVSLVKIQMVVVQAVFKLVRKGGTKWQRKGRN